MAGSLAPASMLTAEHHENPVFHSTEHAYRNKLIGGCGPSKEDPYEKNHATDERQKEAIF